MIDKASVISAISAAKRGGDNPRSLNAFVATLLEAFWKQDELARFSLTGNACPSKPGSVAKEKFPEHYLDAISRKFLSAANLQNESLLLISTFYLLTDFTIKQWAVIFKDSRVSDGDVRKSVSDKLLNAHTAVVRKKKKEGESASVIMSDDGNSSTSNDEIGNQMDQSFTSGTPSPTR